MTPLPTYAPTNGAWVDSSGRLTAAAQLWLRDLWIRVGGAQGLEHGELAGLSDDDHPQYLNNARGDLRYQQLDADLTAIAALATTAYGRALLTTADAAALTAAVDTATSALKGLAPASGGGTTNFLRADMTWAAPPGGGGGGSGYSYFPGGWG